MSRDANRSKRALPAGAGRGRADLLAALADASTYGVETVELHETHASWVFLAGDRAFKVKKPLALGFLDYSTLARRHSACIEEVRVNRELAPDIYIGVRSILRTREGFALACEDARGAVEYAVEMRRFREADTLAGLIDAGRLSSAHIDAVARRLAGFHRAAPVVEGGGAQATLRMWQRNFDELASTSAGVDLGCEAAPSQDFGEAFIARHGRELELRRESGLVRDGHGDLRCEHVLALPSVRVVDRIEFDPGLRHTDIACDLAFLTMDLEASGQRWAAEELTSRYREHGMDPGSEPLLAFFGAYRALVRAKVALIAAAEHDDDRSSELRAKARSRRSLAERLCWRARSPVAVLICGPPASGKSTLAAELSRRSGLAVVSSDATRKAAAGLGPTERARPEHYSERFTQRTYELLTEAAHSELRDSGGVILDATCRSREQRALVLRRLGAAGVTLVLVHCHIPLAVALVRARERMHDESRVSDASPQIVAEGHEAFQALEDCPPAWTLELDTRLPLEDQLRKVTSAVDLRLGAIEQL